MYIVSTLFDLGRLEPRTIESGQQESLLAASLTTLSEYAMPAREFETMWSRVVDRLVAIHAQLAALPEKSRESVFQFAMIIFRMFQLKAAISSDTMVDTMVARFVASSALTVLFRDAHTELTFFERAAGLDSNHSSSRSDELAGGVMVDWDEQCSRDELELLKLFRAVVGRFSPQEWAVSLANAGWNDARVREALDGVAFLLQHTAHARRVLQFRTAGSA